MSEPFDKDFEGQAIRTIYRKMKKTAKARFNAAKRLERQQDFLAWSTALFSIGLIVLALFSAFEIPIVISDKLNSLLQVVLALVLLVASVLLSGKSFDRRASSMHSCGLEIQGLCNSILDECSKDTPSPAVTSKANEKYATILSAYDNHAKIDNDMVEADMKTEYGVGAMRACWIRIRYALCFWIYIVLLLVFVAVVALTLGLVPNLPDWMMRPTNT